MQFFSVNFFFIEVEFIYNIVLVLVGQDWMSVHTR